MPVGRLSFENAEIGGNLLLTAEVEDNALPVPLSHPQQYAHPDGEPTFHPPFVNLQSAQVAGEVRITLDRKVGIDPPGVEPSVKINAKDAHFGTLDLTRYDPAKFRWCLEGLNYEWLRYDEKINWSQWTDLILKRENGVQPYDHLSKLLRDVGEEHASKLISVARERRITDRLRRACHDKEGMNFSTCIEWFWRRVVEAFVGYGYKPGRAFILLIILVVIGGFIFRYAYTVDNPDMFPTRAEYYTGGVVTHTIGERTYKHAAIEDQYYATNEHCEGAGCYAPKNYPAFNPWVYSLELATPLPDLGLEEHWDVKGEGQPWSLLEMYKWLHMTAGCLLSFLIVLSPIALLRKD